MAMQSTTKQYLIQDKTQQSISQYGTTQHNTIHDNTLQYIWIHDIKPYNTIQYNTPTTQHKATHTTIAHNIRYDKNGI